MYKYLIIVLITLLLSGCNVNENTKIDSEVDESMAFEELVDELNDVSIVEYKKNSPEEAKALMVEGNLILDVRTLEEYEDGYIEGAMLLPVDQILAGNYGDLNDKNQVILIYCRSGNRSEKAARALIEAGYTKVCDFGGIIDWPYEIVK